MIPCSWRTWRNHQWISWRIARWSSRGGKCNCFVGYRCWIINKWRLTKWCWNLGRSTRGSYPRRRWYWCCLWWTASTSISIWGRKRHWGSQQFRLFCDEEDDSREILSKVNTDLQRAIAKRKKQKTIKDYFKLWLF